MTPIIVWLTGAIIFYFIYRRSAIKGGKYTKWDRTFGILMSCFSWASISLFASFYIVGLLISYLGNEEKAKW